VQAEIVEAAAAPEEIVTVAVSGNYLDSLSAPPAAVPAPIQEVVTPVEASRRGKFSVKPTPAGLTFQWAWSNSWSSRNEL
jgi:hypothetical protein